MRRVSILHSDSSESSKKRNSSKVLKVPKILVHSASTVMRQIHHEEFFIKLSCHEVCFKIRNFGLFQGCSTERLPKFLGNSQLTFYELQEIENSNSEIGADDIKIVQCKNDGNSLFRAVADQVFGDQNSYDILRARACDQVISNGRISNGMNQDMGNLAGYILKMRQDGVPGGIIELIALANLLDRTILVFDLKRFDLEKMFGVCLPVPQVIRPFKKSVSQNNDYVRLTDHGDGHYNSLVKLK